MGNIMWESYAFDNLYHYVQNISDVGYNDLSLFIIRSTNSTRMILFPH